MQELGRRSHAQAQGPFRQVLAAKRAPAKVGRRSWQASGPAALLVYAPLAGGGTTPPAAAPGALLRRRALSRRRRAGAARRAGTPAPSPCSSRRPASG